MNKEVDAHEDPDLGESEAPEVVGDGDADDANEDEAGVGPGHDDFGGSGSAEAGFDDEVGGEGGLENAAHEDEGDGEVDEAGGFGIGGGEDEMDDDLRGDEEEDANTAHEDDGVEPGGAEGFHGHGGVVGAEVLADEGGGGGAHGEAGKEAEGLDPNGDEVSAEGSLKGKGGDEAEDVGVDEPHAEHFDSLGDANAGDTGDHFALGNPAGALKGEGDFIGLRSSFSEEEGDDDDGADSPSEEAAVSEAGDAHSADGRLEEYEAGAQGGIAEVDEKHHEEGGAGVTDGAEGIGGGVEDAEDGAGPAEDGKVL